MYMHMFVSTVMLLTPSLVLGTSQNVHAVLNSKALPLLIRGIYVSYKQQGAIWAIYMYVHAQTGPLHAQSSSRICVQGLCISLESSALELYRTNADLPCGFPHLSFPSPFLTSLPASLISSSPSSRSNPQWQCCSEQLSSYTENNIWVWSGPQRTNIQRTLYHEVTGTHGFWFPTCCTICHYCPHEGLSGVHVHAHVCNHVCYMINCEWIPVRFSFPWVSATCFAKPASDSLYSSQYGHRKCSLFRYFPLYLLTMDCVSTFSFLLWVIPRGRVEKDTIVIET